MRDKGWFADWFNTEYYHKLYQNRSDAEASKFLHNLRDLLQLPKDAVVADIACGKGRHSRVLAGMGLKVFGYDLSENSINYAQKHASGSEVFRIHDIRNEYPEKDFAAAFNLFTSFGYFDSHDEDRKALQNIFDMLQPGGIFIQDYINGVPVAKSLPHSDHKKQGDTEFFIEKELSGCHVLKHITVQTPKYSKQFTERVMLYTKAELETLHLQTGFDIQAVYGNYQLEAFNEAESPRIIIMSRKPL